MLYLLIYFVVLRRCAHRSKLCRYFCIGELLYREKPQLKNTPSIEWHIRWHLSLETIFLLVNTKYQDPNLTAQPSYPTINCLTSTQHFHHTNMKFTTSIIALCAVLVSVEAQIGVTHCNADKYILHSIPKEPLLSSNSVVYELSSLLVMLPDLLRELHSVQPILQQSQHARTQLVLLHPQRSHAKASKPTVPHVPAFRSYQHRLLAEALPWL